MKFILALIIFILLGCRAHAADTTPEVVTGWTPSAVGSVGAFYLNGNYNLINAGIFFGSAFVWADKKSNVNSAGLYLGPHSSQVDGITTTTIDAMAYLNLYQTASVGSFGIGAGTQVWQSGKGMGIAYNTTYLALGWKY